MIVERRLTAKQARAFDRALARRRGPLPPAPGRCIALRNIDAKKMRRGERVLEVCRDRRGYYLTVETQGLRGSDPVDRFADLQRQGFMKPRKARKPKTPPPMVACDWCMNWHRKGKHTRPGAPRGVKQRVV